MILTILGFSAICCAITFIAILIVTLFSIVFDKDCDICLLVLVVIFVFAVICSTVCRLAFSESLDNDKLARVKEHHAQMFERCPVEVGECAIKWLDYRADSLRAEYNVQKVKYE